MVFLYAEDKIPDFIKVTLILALLSKWLTKLVNDARLTLCILDKTAVKNVFKITTSFMVLI